MTQRVPTFILSALCLATLVGGCASTPKPEVICTAEWIQPRADRALKRLDTRTDRAFRAVRKAAASYVAGDTPGPLTLLSLKRSLNDLEDELRDGPGMRDLRTLASTCNDPDFVSEQFTALLERQRVPDRVIGLLDSLGLLERLVAIAEGTGEALPPEG